MIFKIPKKVIRLLLVLSICMYSCKECPTENPQNGEDTTISLNLIHRDCISALIQVEMNVDSTQLNTFLLKNDVDTLGEYHFHGSDTALTISNLEPSTDYSFLVVSPVNKNKSIRSDTVMFRTMDLSNKQFTAETFRYNTVFMVMRDAWIFDENNIWVIGTFDLDTDGDGYEEPYNFSIFNGNEWQPKLIELIGNWGSDIIAFSEDDIWVLECSPINIMSDFIGERYRLYNQGIIPDTICLQAMYSISPSDIYFAGPSGSLVHYDGEEFSALDSGTDFDIVNIDGDEYGNMAYVARNPHNSQETQVMILKNGKWQELLHSYSVTGNLSEGDYGYLNCLDVFDGFVYIVTFNHLVRYHFETGNISRIYGRQSGIEMFILDHNDIMIFTSYGSSFFYNGKTFTEISDGTPDTYYYSGHYNGQMGCIAGDHICIVRQQ